MTPVHALILSVVEGLTEFLPVSSTGHLILTSHLMGIADSEFTKSFEIFIQLGAILAVVWLYWKKIITRRELWLPVFVAFLPAAIVGGTLYKSIKSMLLGNAFIVVCALAVGGIVLIIIEKFIKPGTEKLSLKRALIIGIFQTLSIIPGVSRAAATIIGGMFAGLSRADAVEFSFLLAIPTMTAATGLDLFQSSMDFSSNEISLLLTGFIGAFVTALAAVKFLVRYIQNHDFTAFGIYRILLAAAYFAFILR